MSKKPATSKKQALIESSISTTALIPIAANPEHNGHKLGIEEIRMAAYLKWEAAGKPESDGVSFWSEAEQELRSKED